MANDRKHWYWRDTSLNPSFFGLDASASIPFLFFILHSKTWSFWLCFVSMLFLGILGKFGFTLPVFYRKVRRFLGGNVCVARPWWYWKRFLRR